MPDSDGMINLQCCLHELNTDEERTCRSIVHDIPGSQITPMPTHHIDEHGSVSGFSFSCPGNSPISAIPLSRYTFHGHTACECDVTSSDIIRLLSDIGGAKKTMESFLFNVRERCSRMPVATFSCRPENAEGYSSSSSNIGGGVGGGTGGRSGQIRAKRTTDSNDWVPEVPNMIGIYHSFVRGHNRDTRVHKLFIIVSGGCGKAADEFYNCVLDCHGHATARDCAMSEEAWWLKRASYRSRCRLIAECARAFDIKINHIRDIHAYDTGGGLGVDSNSKCGIQETSSGGVRIAVPTTDTVTHDLVVVKNTPGSCSMQDGTYSQPRDKSGDVVQLFDSCVDVNSVRNGLLCSMHPSEGYWIFKGAQNRAQGTNAYGTAWHCRKSSDVAMPTSVIKIHHNDMTRKNASTTSGASFVGSTTNATSVRDKNNDLAKSLKHAVVSTMDSHCIVRVNSVKQIGANGVEIPPEMEKDVLYQFFDEPYLSLVSDVLGWPRDRGVVELIPIVVGMGVVG